MGRANEGHNMTTIEDNSGGEEYGVKDAPDEETKDEKSQPLEESVEDGSGETGSVDGGDQQDQGQDQGQEQPVSGEDEIAKIREELKGVRDELQKSVEAKKEAVQNQQKPLSDEEWARIEEQWGGMDRRQIQAITSHQLASQQQLLNSVESKFAKFEKESVLQEISREPKFTDALNHRTQINEFLKDYDPRYHANKDVLKRAIYYSRGLSMDKTIQKVQNSKERNRRITGAARPTSQSVTTTPKQTQNLTAIEKSAARAVGMSDEEYSRIKTNSNRME